MKLGINSNVVRLFALLILITSLAGCMSPKPASTAAENKTITWSQRKQDLQQITRWQANGAIAIRDQQQAQSASVKWQQQSQSTFAIRLFGPLGVGNTIIIGKPGNVTLTTPENKTYTATSSEALLQQQTGWQLPISNLYYWVRGLPAPGSKPQMKLDPYNHLRTLQQSGWNILYQRYTAVKGKDLPSKITMTNGPITAKLIINRWVLS